MSYVNQSNASSLPPLQSSSINETSIVKLKNKKYTIIQNILYGLQKKAFTDYLTNNKVNKTILNMNLLNISQMKDQQIQQLQTILDIDDQAKKDELHEIFSRKKKNFQSLDNLKNIITKKKTSNIEDIEFEQFQNKMREILIHKIRSQKIFNGTHLVDPTFDELSKQKIKQRNLPKIHQELQQSPRKISAEYIKYEKPASITQQKLKYDDLFQKNYDEINFNLQNAADEELKNQQDSITDLQRMLNPQQNKHAIFIYLDSGDAMELMLQVRKNKKLLDLVDENGNSVLHIAIKKNLGRIVRFLIKEGSDIFKKNKQGNDCLEFAQIYGTKEILMIVREAMPLAQK